MKRKAGVRDAQTSLRLSADLLKRADALVEPLRYHADKSAPGLAASANRSDVLRLALERGLTLLEQKYNVAGNER